VRDTSKLSEKNSKTLKIIQEGSPTLGIFWVHPKTKELIAPHQEPLDHGDKDPDLDVVDARMTHSELWNTVKGYHPDLKHLQYHEVPRGRVYYKPSTKKFHVMGPEAHMKDPEVQRKVRSEFNLRRPNTKFEGNSDYEKGRGD
jgi:hypothetical protein